MAPKKAAPAAQAEEDDTSSSAPASSATHFAIAPPKIKMFFDFDMASDKVRATAFVKYVRLMQREYPDTNTYKTIHDASTFFPIQSDFDAFSEIVKLDNNLDKPTASTFLPVQNRD